MKSNLIFPKACLSVIHEEVKRYGECDLETGGFFLTESESDEIDVLALAGEIGITRTWGLFQVSGKAIERLFDWADGETLRISAQLHSHCLSAFLSETDTDYGFNVDGFQTSVIPSYCNPPFLPQQWRWWQFTKHRWIEIGSPELGSQNCRIIKFDERGIIC
jgi:hypothetical protein